MNEGTNATRRAPRDIGGGALGIIVVRSIRNGRWGYCPKSARELLRPELDDEARHASLRDALNAIALDKSIPKGTPIEVEHSGAESSASDEIPVFAAAGTPFDSLELECNAPRLDPFASWPFPKEGP